MAYVGRAGADSGGGFNECGALDELIPGGGIAGGDTWGLRLTRDHGNQWLGCMAGLPTTTTPPHGRSAMMSRRPETAGVGFFGTGTSNNPGTGSLYVVDTQHSLVPVQVSSGSGNGFGVDGWSGGGGGGTGPNAAAKRPCGWMMDSYVAGDAAHSQYIFAFTHSGVQRWEDTATGGTLATRMNAIGNHVSLVPNAAIPGQTSPAHPIRSGLCVLDSKHIVIINYDRIGGSTTGGGGTIINTQMWMVTAGPTGALIDLGVAAPSQINVTPLSIPVHHCYEIAPGNDGVFYAACAYDGVWTVALNGSGGLSWTHISAPGGVERTDLCVSSATADSQGNVFATQAGGNTSGSLANDSAGMIAGHAIVQGSPDHSTWTYPASVAAVHMNEFQPGDGVAGTGRLFWLRAEKIVLTGVAYDGSQIRVDPNDDNRIVVWGRTGCWQSRDGGASWYPAMNGMNGSQSKVSRANGLIKATGASAWSAANDDWVESHSSDDFQTAVKGTTQPATGHATTTNVTSFTGVDGATYVFTKAASGQPAQVTRNGVRIDDELFRGQVISPTGVDASGDGTFAVNQNGGGVFLLDPSGSPPPPLPTITSFTPATASIGDTITINGTHLDTATGVVIGGKAASFAIINAGQITATVPIGASSGQTITVTNAGGSGTSTGTLTVTPPAPTINSFSPTTGAVGDTVTVSGTHLDTVTVVRVGGSGGVAATIGAQSAGSLTFTIPTGSSTGTIYISGPGGTATSGTSLIVLPPPTITSFAPSSGVPGDTITITGTHLDTITAVKIGGASGATAPITSQSPTSLAFTIPAGAATGRVYITGPSGNATSSTNLTVAIPALPTVTSFTPARGPIGTTVTLSGTHLDTVTVVKVKGAAGAAAVISSQTATSLTFDIPSGAASGRIYVKNPAGTALSATSFVVTAPPPTITGFSPSSGMAGDPITIAGTHLDAVSVVKVGGSAGVAATITAQSPTSLTFDIPSGAGTGRIYVKSSGGSATSPTALTVTASPTAPTITSFTPSSGAIGDPITVTGTHLDTVTAAKVGGSGGVAATITAQSATSLTLDIPGGATTGKIYVSNPGGSALSGTALTVIPQAPQITSFAPTSAPPDTVITVNGAGFDSITSVLVGGTPASFTIDSSIRLTFLIPEGATSGPILLSGGSGSTSSTRPLTITSPPPPPPPPQRQPRILGLVGCSEYQLLVYPRGLGTRPVGSFDFPGWTGLTWERRLNQKSQVTVTFAQLAQSGPRCLSTFAATRKWQHELVVIRREDGRIWSGPILSRSVSGGTGTITAWSLDLWLERRDLLKDHTLTGDLVDSYAAMWHDAIDRNNDMGYQLVVAGAAGQTLALQPSLASDHVIAASAIQPLIDAGLDYTTIDRATIIGPPSAVIVTPQVVDDHVSAWPDVSDDGANQTNRYGVIAGAAVGGNKAAPYEEDVRSDLVRRDGELVTIEQNQLVTNGKGARLLARQRTAAYADPAPDAQTIYLRPTAPFSIVDDLIPGHILDVRIYGPPIPLDGFHRITRVFGTLDSQQGEQVGVEFVPYIPGIG